MKSECVCEVLIAAVGELRFVGTAAPGVDGWMELEDRWMEIVLGRFLTDVESGIEFFDIFLPHKGR